MRPAPALLKWIRCAHPGVSERRRSRSRSIAEHVGISVDGIWSPLAFAKDRNLHFPLLADFEPKGEVARTYQVYRATEGTSERALYVIGGDGIVWWSYVSPVGVNPGADGILRALEGLEEAGS